MKSKNNKNYYSNRFVCLTNLIDALIHIPTNHMALKITTTNVRPIITEYMFITSLDE